MLVHHVGERVQGVGVVPGRGAGRDGPRVARGGARVGRARRPQRARAAAPLQRDLLQERALEAHGRRRAARHRRLAAY